MDINNNNNKMIQKINSCSCGSDKPAYWINDGYGIPLCKVCENCKSEKLKGYRSDIMDNYDCDEAIDSD